MPTGGLPGWRCNPPRPRAPSDRSTQPSHGTFLWEGSRVIARGCRQNFGRRCPEVPRATVPHTKGPPPQVKATAGRQHSQEITACNSKIPGASNSGQPTAATTERGSARSPSHGTVKAHHHHVRSPLQPVPRGTGWHRREGVHSGSPCPGGQGCSVLPDLGWGEGGVKHHRGQGQGREQPPSTSLGKPKDNHIELGSREVPQPPLPETRFTPPPKGIPRCQKNHDKAREGFSRPKATEVSKCNHFSNSKCSHKAGSASQGCLTSRRCHLHFPQHGLGDGSNHVIIRTETPLLGRVFGVQALGGRKNPADHHAGSSSRLHF